MGRYLALVTTVAFVCIAGTQAAESRGGPGDSGGALGAFTFLFWTDQEIDPKTADIAKLLPTVQAMNSVAGKAYPAAIGGVVEAPDFVASGGDSTTWPTRAAVTSWNKICRELLRFPTRAVAGNHDSGGDAPSESFYDWLRGDAFVKAHAADNGLPAWSPPRAGTGIIPGIQYSFVHKGVVFLMPSPTYDSSPAQKPGYSPIFGPDLEWLRRELAKYDPKLPKIVVNHYNADSITNREELDAIYAANNVLLHLCGHWERVQHWQLRSTDWVMDAGHRGEDGTFSVVRVERERLVLAHWVVRTGSWHDIILIRRIPPRW